MGKFKAFLRGALSTCDGDFMGDVFRDRPAQSSVTFSPRSPESDTQELVTVWREVGDTIQGAIGKYDSSQKTE